jgi:hypothetical protein
MLSVIPTSCSWLAKRIMHGFSGRCETLHRTRFGEFWRIVRSLFPDQVVTLKNPGHGSMSVMAI